MNKKIYFAGPSISDQDIETVLDACKNGWYDRMAYHVTGLEEQMKKYLGTNYAMATMCCTNALHLACISIGLKEGDEVIVTDHSWAATAHTIAYTGATCVFVDIDPRTLCIDPQRILEAITPKTKAIMLVHNFGIPAKMNQIMDIAKHFNLKVIEDAAPALGALYKGVPVGSIGDIGCFSFQGGKMTVANEGGIFTTNNQEYYNIAQLMGNMGRTNREFNFWSDHLGFEYPMGNLQASLAWSQVKRIQQLVSMKRQIHKWYFDRFENDDRFQMITEYYGDRANYCYPSIWIKKYNNAQDAVQIVNKLKQKNIHCRNGFPQMSLFPMYQQRYKNPIAQSFMYNGIVLPSALNITEDDVDKVVVSILECI